MDFHILDNASLKSEFTREQLIDFANDLLYTQIELVCAKFDQLGIYIARTGGIDNGIGGIKCYVDHDYKPSDEVGVPNNP